MKSIFSLLIPSALLLSLTVGVARAKGPRYDDPQKVDADFAYQGEYSGFVGTGEEKTKVGVQVIALGGGKFQAVAYFGGLPGDGWNKKETIRTDGKLNGEQVVFSTDMGSGIVKDGNMTISNANGEKVGEFQRVERTSETLGKKPPEGAVVLFDGSEASLKNWKNGRMTEDGLLMEGTTSKERFGDHSLHMEFRLAYQPEDRGQGRSNSGVYAQGRYEVQILDSFGLEGKHNECGGIYSVKAPDENMCFPPLSWQTYDIDFTAAKFESGKLVANPRMTVRHNGVVIHDDVELPGERSTTAAPMKPSAEPGPIYFQNHGCPLRYRNIWVTKR